jgi:hypothetical protein
MAFSDPQSITISAATTSLPRVTSGDGESKYSSSDGLIDLSASSSYGNRIRRVIRVDHSKVTADPFIPAQNREVSMSNYMVFDVPNVGYTNAEIKAVYVGFNTLYTASSHALIDKLLGGES